MRTALLLSSTPWGARLCALRCLDPTGHFSSVWVLTKPLLSLTAPCAITFVMLLTFTDANGFLTLLFTSVKLANPFGHGPEPEAPGNVLLTFSCSICMMVQCRGPNTAVRHILGVHKGKIRGCNIRWEGKF